MKLDKNDSENPAPQFCSVSQIYFPSIFVSAVSNNECKSMKLDKNQEQRKNYQIYLEDQGTLIILDSFLMTEVMETPLLIKKKDMASLFSCQEAATVIHHGEQAFLIFIPRQKGLTTPDPWNSFVVDLRVTRVRLTDHIISCLV